MSHFLKKDTLFFKWNCYEAIYGIGKTKMLDSTKNVEAFILTVSINDLEMQIVGGEISNTNYF